MTTQQASAQPASGEELRDVLCAAASAKKQIELAGNRSKRLFGGVIDESGVRISTKSMRRILRYEPRDLTISVEAGMPFAELQTELARNGQMIPLDGPFSDQATVGGVIATNTNGPRRRLYGTARDLVIGMRFATVDGRLADTGGMVVKNVAGLDIAKILIGSYGTLAAIVSVNFKLIPKPLVERTFLFRYETVPAAAEAVGRIMRGQLSPAAIELVNPLLAAQLNLRGYTLALSFGGNDRLMERIEREMASFGTRVVQSADEDRKFWRSLHAVSPRFLDKFSEGVVVRVSTPVSESVEALGMLDFAGSAHAGSGIVRGWFTRPDAATRYLAACMGRGWDGIIEAAGTSVKTALFTLWPKPGVDFAMMKRVKEMFDPQGLLNRGRLFQRI